jgi:hypothetical protein
VSPIETNRITGGTWGVDLRSGKAIDGKKPVLTCFIPGVSGYIIFAQSGHFVDPVLQLVVSE